MISFGLPRMTIGQLPLTVRGKSFFFTGNRSDEGSDFVGYRAVVF